MAIFGSDKLDSMEDLFWMQAADLYDAEKQLIQALPRLAEAAHDPKLKEAFKEHLSQTRRQAARLEEIYRTFGRDPEARTCEAMKGLIRESDEVIRVKGDPSVKDAALIAAGQRVEHYEISGYGTLRAIATRLGHRQAADLLRSTLSEEKEADHLLSFIAEGRISGPEAG